MPNQTLTCPTPIASIITTTSQTNSSSESFIQAVTDSEQIIDAVIQNQNKLVCIRCASIILLANKAQTVESTNVIFESYKHD